MAKDSWLEPRTRIPFAGIIGIVLIVAVVAIFFKVALNPGQLTVSGLNDDDEVSRTGKASSSFGGLRVLSLQYKERLHGVLNNADGALLFTIDVPARILVIEHNSREEVLLSPTNDGLGLTATFEFENRQTKVNVYPGERRLLYSRPGSSVGSIEVSLGDSITYESLFLYRSKQYLFQFSPLGTAVFSAGDEYYETPLVASGNSFSGTWHEHGNDHPVTVNMESLEAEIQEVW